METPEHIRIYCDSLTRLGYGCPIYEPDPGRFEPVQIGDVGYVEPYTGHFHRVFNAFYDAKSAINRFGIPDGFQPLAQDFQDCDRGADLPSGVHCMHIKVDKLVGFDIEGKAIPAGAELELSSSRSQGALIIIKEPAERVNSACRAILAHALEQNHRSWLEFVRRRSPNLDLKKMVLVTGYDLASDWATTTVNESNTNVKIHFKVGDPVSQTVSAAASVWGSWEYSSTVPVRFGPSAFQRQQHLETDTGKNQCIFLRAFRMVRRGFKLKAAAGPHILPSADDDTNDSASAMLMNIEDDSEEDLIYECSDVYDKVFNYLLERTNKEFVLLHDDDVPSILEEIISTERFASVAAYSNDTLDYPSGDFNPMDSMQADMANSPACSLDFMELELELMLKGQEMWNDVMLEQLTEQRQTDKAKVKERSSWFNDAQLSGGSSSGQTSQLTSARRALPTLPTPVQPQQQTSQHVIPEVSKEYQSIPPLPFAPVGKSIDVPALVPSYTLEDPFASPPPTPPLPSPVTLVRELNMQQRDTAPHMSARPSPYKYMQSRNVSSDPHAEF